MVFFIVCNETIIFFLAANILYPYGAAEGDIALPKEDDGGTLVHIDIDFPFFDQNHRSLYVSISCLHFACMWCMLLHTGG